MSLIARQSTARTLIVGPVLDATGVAVTDGVVADLKISKNGAAPGGLNGSATLTHRHTGFYSLALTASDLDTVGQAEITIDDTVNAMPLRVVTVIEEVVYDALFTASATGIMPDEAGVTTLLSRLTSTRAGYLDNLSAGAVATAAKLLSYFQSALRKDVTVDGDIGGNYDDATDSQEAIRDRGDSAWTTAVGFATHSAADVWAVATRLLTAGTNIVLAKGVGVTGFNDLSSAQVNAEADTALADAGVTTTVTGRIDAAITTRASASALSTAQTSIDDLPTNAELATSQAAADDATLAAIAALNNLSSAQAQTAAAAALTAYDPPTRTEATSDKDEVLTAVADVPTNAELATALGTADDAVLAQVALVKAKTDLIPSDPADASDIAAQFSTVNSTLGTIAGYIDTEVAAIVSAIAALNNLSEAQVLAQVAAALTTTVADSAPADGTRPSVSSGIYMLVQFLLERQVSGTTVSVKKPDGSTQLFALTLDDASAPTAITRSA